MKVSMKRAKNRFTLMFLIFITLCKGLILFTSECPSDVEVLPELTQALWLLTRKSEL